MIRGLDHIALAAHDFGAAVEGYRKLLAREPELEVCDGASCASFQLANAGLRIVAPHGAGETGDRVRARLEDGGEGLWMIALAVDDVVLAANLLRRRGLAVEQSQQFARAQAAGLNFMLTARRESAAPSPAIAPAAVAALDHLVAHTPNLERAVANIGGRLGLDLRLDRENARWGARQLFFHCGDVMVEFAAKLDAPVTDAPDRFGGLAWRVTDPDAAQQRLAAAGFNVSEVRQGRKPGTRVFTVRDAPCGAPTLMISAEPSEAA